MSIKAYKTVNKYSPVCISKKVLLDNEIFNLNYDVGILEVFKEYGVMYNEDNLRDLELIRRNIELALNMMMMLKVMLNGMLMI